MLEALLYVSHVAMCALLYLIIMNDEFYRHCKGTACDKMLIIRFQPFYRTIPSRLGVKQGHISTVITNSHDHIYISIRPMMSRPGECTHLFISCNNHFAAELCVDAMQVEDQSNFHARRARVTLKPELCKLLCKFRPVN